MILAISQQNGHSHICTRLLNNIDTNNINCEHQATLRRVRHVFNGYGSLIPIAVLLTKMFCCGVVLTLHVED
jgi:hypothetical protein